MIAAEDKSTTIRLRVAEASSRDVGRGLVRLDPVDMERIGARSGDIVRIAGERTAVGKVLPAYRDGRGQSRVQIDGLLREAAGCGIDSYVEVTKIEAKPAIQVTLRLRKRRAIEDDVDYILTLICGLPMQQGGIVRATLFGNELVDFEVGATAPAGPVVVTSDTRLVLERTSEEYIHRTPSYEDIGGAKAQLRRIREMIELPLRFPEVFDRLGIDAPKGVLLYGPPGCGKTLIARAIAHETDAKFFSISGPEIIHKFYGESEAHLRKVFQEASKQGPSIIFLDEIDAIAPKRENAAGDVERRVVAQLLALMDGLNRRENVIVIAATNLPNSIDPALRRPGRFDREIEIPIPDRSGRKHILDIHSRGMPLDSSVDLNQLASITHGFVGADLEALCREAAMSCLRGVLDDIDFAQAKLSSKTLASMHVTMAHFMQGFQSVEPSALREVFVEVPSVRWEDIGGHDGIKQKLQEAIIWPLKYENLFSQVNVRPPRGILLCGPPGCGKTMLAKAAASESQVNFISVKGPELLSKFIGESERAVREIFSKARLAAPCLMFFDEIDGLCASRQSGGSDSGVSSRVLTQFLVEMDGVQDLDGVFVLAATNRPDLVDSALKRFGRFEQTIEVGLPNAEGRLQILGVHLRDKPLDEDFNISDLATSTEGFTGADLASVCSSAARSAIRRTIRSSSNGNAQSGTLVLTRQDFEEALASVVQQIGRRS